MKKLRVSHEIEKVAAYNMIFWLLFGVILGNLFGEIVYRAVAQEISEEEIIDEEFAPEELQNFYSDGRDDVSFVENIIKYGTTTPEIINFAVYDRIYDRITQAEQRIINACNK